MSQKVLIARGLVPALVLALALGAGGCVPAQQNEASASGYQPKVGQAGRDVVWVPTPQALVDAMLDVAKVGPQDFVIDLGSGDGRTVITAAKRGANALGIEYNPDMVRLARRNAQDAGVAARARFEREDLFQTDLSRASVITMFLLQSINIKLRPKLLELEPGTRIVSNSFTMGDWEADQTVTLDQATGCGAWCTALLWIVPARVEGRHETTQGELLLEQTYQMLGGTLRAEGRSIPVKGRVRGREVLLEAAGRELRGTVKNGRLALER